MTYINDCGVPKDEKCGCHYKPHYPHCPIILECGGYLLPECCDEEETKCEE